MKHSHGINLKNSFTLVELLVVIVLLIVLVGLLLPGGGVHEKARRVNCLANMNGIWKSIAALNINQDFSYFYSPSNFPATNLAGPDGLFTLNRELLTPEMFVCPTAAKDYGTKPAGKLSNVMASNCSYCYFGGGHGSGKDDREKVVLCDQNGPLTAASPTNWGLNHRGKHGRAEGGNVVKVDGSGAWVSTTNDLESSNVCITNAYIATKFQTNSDIVIFLH